MLSHKLNLHYLRTDSYYSFYDNEPNDIEFMDVTQSNERGFYDWGFSITSITHPFFLSENKDIFYFNVKFKAILVSIAVPAVVIHKL